MSEKTKQVYNPKHYFYTDAAAGSLSFSSNVHIWRIRDAGCIEDSQSLYGCLEYEGQQQTVVTVNCGKQHGLTN